MNKRMNRIFAFFLAMAIVVGCMPTAAFAAQQEGWSSDYSKYFQNDVAYDVEVVGDPTPATCEKGTITSYRAYDEEGNTIATTEVEANDKLGHSYEKGLVEVIKEATCEEEGSHYRKCDRKGCDYVDKSKVIKDPAKGHTAAKEPEVKIIKEATCVEAGSKEEIVYCEDCGAVISRTTVEIPTSGAHKWKEENTEEKKPTCTEAGSVTVKRTCEICGETETETVTTEALGHKWKLNKTITKATCGKDGKGEYICERCNAKETRAIPASGEHDFSKYQQVTDDDRFKAPTCDKPGVEVWAYFCANCGEEEEDSRETVTVDPLEHHYSKNYEVKELRGQSALEITSTNATCTLPGQTIRTCKLCGETFKTVDQPLDHEYEKDKDGKIKIVKETIKKAATCEEDGIKVLTYHCTRCNEDITQKDEVVIPAPGHKALAPVKEVVKAATCTEKGEYNLVSYCSVCKKAIDDESEYGLKEEATGHDFGEAPIEQNCQYALYKCNKCGSLEKRAKEKIKHDWKLTKTTKEATCEEDGDGIYTCQFCGTTKNDIIKALGHDWSQTVKKPTCTEKGIAGGTCSRCKRMEAEFDIPALGDTFDADKTTAKAYWDANVKGKGYILYTTVCSNGCGEKKEQAASFEAPKEDGEEEFEVKLNLEKGGEPTEATATYILKRTSKPSKEATCDKPGEKTVTVTVRHTLPSGKIVADSTTWTEVDKDAPAKGHINVETVKEKVVEPNCAKETDGSYVLVVKCKDCGKEISKKSITEKWQHTPAKEPVRENEKNKDSDTETYTWEDVYYCTVCGKEVRRVNKSLKKDGHVPGETVKENIVEPDCLNGRDGYYDEVTYCKDCDPKVVIKRERIIIPAEHNYVWTSTPVKEATCTEKGSEHWEYKCTRCGDVLIDDGIVETSALGHDAFFTKTIVTKEATCTEEGATVEATFCGRCFEEIKRSEETKIPATGHQWDGGVVTKVPTDTEKGEMTFTCLLCGETKTEEIDNSGLAKKESTIVLNNKLVYYNGKVQAFDATDAKVNGSKGAVTFEYFSDSKCTKKISAPTNCGNYYAKATVAADAGYAGATSSVAKLRILRVYQGFSVAGKTVTVSAASLKSANQTIPQSKAVTLRKGNDQVKFVKAIWTYNSPITVDKAGNIQLRKGLKAGTYTVKCKAYTPATKNYLRTVKVYTVTIKVQ